MEKHVLLTCLALVLAACGGSAGTGRLASAAIGSTSGPLLAHDPLAGAAIGGAGGAAIGAYTDPNRLNLGRTTLY